MSSAGAVVQRPRLPRRPMERRSSVTAAAAAAFVFVVMTTMTSRFGPIAVAATSADEMSHGSFDSESHPISHLVVDNSTGAVYVGAVDRLYQLPADLDDAERREVVTGPLDDNPMCPPQPEECKCTVLGCKNPERQPMRGVSKALLIDHDNRQLIHCTNLYQGHCAKYQLADISQPRNGTNMWPMIVPNDESSSVVMYIAPGPNTSSTSSSGGGHPTVGYPTGRILYVAATRSTVGLLAYKDLVPAVCMRNIADFNLFSSDFLNPSKVDVESQHRDTFRINYVYGFSSSRFSYFITVQRPAAVDSAMQDTVVSRIVRVCQGNPALTHSYAEVPIECRRRGQGDAYKVVQAATVTHVGSRLARSLGLSDEEPATDIEHVLIIVFSRQSSASSSSSTSGQQQASASGSGSSSSSGTSSSTRGDGGNQSLALCVIPVVEVRRTFTTTIQKCFRGGGNTGPDYIVRPVGCTSTSFEIDDNYCGNHGMNNPVNGTDVITLDAAVTWSGAAVTSLAVTTTDQHTVAFVGTDNGLINKILIESASTAIRYETVAVESRLPVGRQMAFDVAQRHVYVTAGTKVLRLPVERCSVFSSCDTCLGSNDPYCGWCSLESKCSLKSECLNSDIKSRWLPYHYKFCPKIVAVEPRHVQKQLNEVSPIQLTIQSLPHSSNWTYECVFSGHGVTRITQTSRLVVSDNANSSMRCNTPAFNLLPPFPTGKDHIEVQLSVRLVGTQSYLTTNFTFYDCGVHTSCTRCTDSDYPCKWCLRKNVCVNHANSEDVCTRSDVMITGRQLPGNTDNPGPFTCPRIDNIGNSSEILISSGRSRDVTLKVLYLQDFQREFKCHFNVDGGVEVAGELITVNGTSQRRIRCRDLTFAYTAQTGFINVPISIMWLNGDEYSPLDNPRNVQVRMFKCSAMASSCGGCRRIDPVYGCGWYSDSRQCCVRNECPGTSYISTEDICSNPVIRSVSPLSGPAEGGTSVTITGVDLGVGLSDTQISVAGVPCIITSVDPFVSYVCTTSRVKEGMLPLGSVIVKVSNDQSQSASVQAVYEDEEFAYVKPEVFGFDPEVGPKSGGTRLTIEGQHLNVGSSVSVTLINGNISVNCQLLDEVDRASDYLVCETAASEEPAKMSSLLLTIDAAKVAFTGFQTFEFTVDPVIDSVQAEKTIVSGGLLLTVRGRYLSSIAKPQLVVYDHASKSFMHPCMIWNDTTMTCRTPDLRRASIAGNASSSSTGSLQYLAALSYGFVMDGSRQLLNYTNVTLHSGKGTPHWMFVFPDPQFEKFDDGVRQMFLPRNDYLTINGKHLNLVLDESNFAIRIGERECRVTSMSATQLVCKLYVDDDDNEPFKSGTLVTVQLNTMQNLSYDIGELKYEPSSIFTFSLTVILALVGGGVFVLVIIIAALIAYKRKSRENDRVMKRMQNQMDVLEIRVAKECKEAFAELQTDMTEIAGEISGSSGIPFRTYRSFCMSVLFPGIPPHAHPVTQSFECDESTSRGLNQFNQLLGTKTFLLLFIRTMENDKEFLMRDKVNVASLLSVVLQNRMEYHTDILKTLLADLIERAMESRNHPKLLLRRTDSVAEKMLTNWFTFLLYRYLVDCAGEPLFLLFRAVKQQIDKGPVDMLTGEARYSLSEDKLIRQQIEYKQLTVRVTDPDGQLEHHVRVLDCDSITQVKEKILDAIYRNTPFSHRPSKEELDLEWHTGQRSRFIMKDEDMTTCSESGFRRVNTLAHYKVLDGALLALIPRQSSTSCYDLSNVSDRSSFHHRYEEYFSASPGSLTRSMAPNAVTTEIDNGGRSCHLVRTQEADLQRDCERGGKMVSEIYLTRLLTTKVALQQFVDDLFETIFCTASRGCSLPPAVKYMFDFLDDQALLHNINDPEVVHTWKSNILPLRFWVNVIKNPDFVFDVHKSNIVDSCLSVVAQTFMDCCSMSEHKLGKDSPSSKLLYAKDIPKYRKWVERYYQDIQQMPAYADQDINAMLTEESKDHYGEFTLNAAVYQLYQYADKYFDSLMDVLEEDEFARNYHLASRLHQVHTAMHMRI